LARRKLHEAEEECCDAWVVWALPHERRSYGQAMLRTIEFLTDGGRVPALAGSALGRSFYQRRIHMILKQSINRRMSWTTCIGVSLLAAAVLPLAAQTAVPTADPAAAAPPIAPAQPATAPAPPAAAVPGAAQALPSADPLAAPGRAPTPASVPSPAADERVSREDLLARIEQLEQMIAVLTANIPQVGAPLSKAPPPTPPLAPVPHPTEDKVELELQGELAQLDVAAAEAELMSALQSVEHAEKLAGEEKGLVPEAELDKLRHAARLKEIALRRARVKLQLFERQVQARRALVPEQFDGLKQQVQHVQDQMLHERAKLAELQAVGEALKAQQAAIHASKRHVADELARLKQMAKELPGDPGTRDAIYEFLTHYLKMSDEEAKAAVERLK
jgi:hypothetical protein